MTDQNISLLPPLGIHVFKGSGYEASIASADEKYILTAVQIFVSGPRNSVSTITIPKCIALKKYLDEAGIALFVHASYTTTLKTTSGNLIKTQMQLAHACGARGLVVHLPNSPPDDIATVINSLMSRFSTDDFPIPLLLEHIGILPSNKTYETPAKINILMSHIIHPLSRIGFVLDTAHLWASGTDITTFDKTKEFFDQLAQPHRIQLIHLNGSYAELGSGKDKHAVPFSPHDNIWGNYVANPVDSGVMAIIKFALTYNVPMILEVNRNVETLLHIGKHPGAIDIIKKLMRI